MALGRFSLREVSARPMRVLLTFISIAIGVGAVVAVLLSISTTRQAQRDMLRAISGKADLEVVSDIARGFPQSLLKQIRDTEGVEVAIPSIKRYAKLFFGEVSARTQVLGIDPRIDQMVRDYEITEGTHLKQYGDIVLDASFARSLGISVGDELRLLAGGGLKPYKVVGLATPRGSTSVSLGSAAYLILPDAEASFGSQGTLDEVQLLIKEDAIAADVETALRAVLPDGVTIQAPRTRSQMAEETMFATENGLYMAIAFAVLIAVFIIYNTFQMSVGERRRQLGILRAVGATRGQVGWMILRESLWISVLASIAGCVLGVYGAGFLTQATQDLMQVQLPNINLTLLPFIGAIAVGVGVSLLGALLPSRRASSVQPLEAIRALDSAHNAEVIAITRPLSVVAFVLGGILLFLAVSGLLPLGGDVTAVIILLLGGVLTIPTILVPLSSFIARGLRPWLGVEAELAQKQLTRHLGRSALTIGVLFVAVAASTGMAGNILDNVRNVKNWYSRAIIGDFFVRATNPDVATGAAADMPAGIEEQLKQVPGITSLDAIRYLNARSGENSVLLIVRDFIGKPTDFFDLVEGTDEQALSGLREGKVVVGTVLTQRLGLHQGDTIPLETQDGTKQLVIAATTNEYFGGGLAIYIQREVAEELLGVSGVDAYVVQADDGQLAAVEKELEAICRENHLILQSYADVVKFINGMVNSVIASLWMLLALGCIIAAMGLVNTLTMNILEQTREIGMLRVVAMTRGQVRRMIVAQAALLGLIGLIPGAMAGIFVAYVISLSAFSIIGHNIVFEMRPLLIFGCLFVGLIVVLVAALIPAERAARLKLSSAMHYE
jgi:putative ABC transport system permease protein